MLPAIAISSLLSPGATPPGGRCGSGKQQKQSNHDNKQPNNRHCKFQNIFYHIDFTDRLCYFLGRGGFPPRNLSDTLYYHFDDGYEGSNFKGKLSECFNHFYQLAYFFVYLRILLSSLDDIKYSIV